MLGILLVAGLWPFRAPKNRVKWVENKDGLQFVPGSGILSTAAFHSKNPRDNTRESIEIWLVPSSIRSRNTILSFDGSDHPGTAFLLSQYKDELIVRQQYIDGHGASRVESLAVGNVVREANSVFVTITLGKQGTSIYLNGTLSETFAKRGTSTNQLTGRLVVAHAPQGRDSWPGDTGAGDVSESIDVIPGSRPLCQLDKEPTSRHSHRRGPSGVVHVQRAP